MTADRVVVFSSEFCVQCHNSASLRANACLVITAAQYPDDLGKKPRLSGVISLWGRAQQAVFFSSIPLLLLSNLLCGLPGSRTIHQTPRLKSPPRTTNPYLTGKITSLAEDQFNLDLVWPNQPLLLLLVPCTCVVLRCVWQ